MEMCTSLNNITHINAMPCYVMVRVKRNERGHYKIPAKLADKDVDKLCTWEVTMEAYFQLRDRFHRCNFNANSKRENMQK
jgi:hypothetical protein